jgi:putative hemolysin
METSGMGLRTAHTIALVAVTVPVALLTLVIGEIAPKSLAVRHPERFALIAVYPIRWLQVLLTPAVVVLTFLSNTVVRPFGGTAHFTTPAVNEEELKILVEAGEEQGVLEPEATEMIHSILDFGDTVVRKVMTPRIDLTAMDVNAPMPDLILLVFQSGHSRIPVYEDDLDSIVGIVHAKDLLALPTDGSRDAVPIRSVMRPPYFIPETKKIDELLKEFRRSKQQLAIVRDEYGVTSGLVTIEDLLEEIVGDIQDEYDVEEPMVQVIDAHTTILDGRLGLSEVNDRMGLELPEDEADTIGGFVFGLLGHQAEQNEHVEWQHLDFIVEATDGRRITKVRLVCHPEKTGTPGHTPPQEEAPKPLRSEDSRRSAVETSGVETAPGAHLLK